MTATKTGRTGSPLRIRGLLIAFALVLQGCVTAPTDGHGSAAAYTVPTEGDGYVVVRRAAAVGQSAYIYANSFYVNPVIRPLSHATSISSYILKSSGGALRRVAIAGVQMPELRGSVPAINHADPMDLDVFEQELDRITQTRQTRGTIEFLVDGDEYFSRLERAIDAATRSIHIRTYIFDNDDYALSFADRLKARSRDVDVRVLVDSLGNMQAMQVDSDTQPTNHRVPLTMNYYLTQESSVRFRRMPNPWLTGDHTKTTIIDREVAFVGGMNIGREYRYDWHDLMMEVRGPVVNELQRSADIAWARAGPFGDLAGLLQTLRGAEKTETHDGYPVRILQTKDFDSDIYKAQLAAIRNARNYILIENPYFSDDRTVYELAKARRRGVDVRVILPEAGNHGLLDMSNLIAINHMLMHGIRVYRYPGMSHTKAAIYDGWVCVGSANFDKLSLKINKELNLATSEQSVAEALLRQVFIPDLLASTEITAPVEIRIADRIAEIAVDELL